jgi:hypothetical protein
MSRSKLLDNPIIGKTAYENKYKFSVFFRSKCDQMNRIAYVSVAENSVHSTDTY